MGDTPDIFSHIINISIGVGDIVIEPTMLFVGGTIVQQTSWSSCFYSLITPSFIVFPDSEVQELCWTLIHWGWDSHYVFPSAYSPVQDFCNGLHLLHREASLMRVRIVHICGYSDKCLE